MTLEEAILHCEEVAERNETFAEKCTEKGGETWGCRECAAEHRQLASWLRELKRMRAQGTCEYCVNKNILMANMEYYGFDSLAMTVTEFAENLFSACKSEPCNDAVSRDSVKYLLCKETCHPGPLCPDGFCKEICEKVDVLPQAKPKNDGWILCSERLPEEPTEVMHELEMYSEYNVVIEGFTIPTTLCYAGDGEWRREESYYNVEKWQPLPKP